MSKISFSDNRQEVELILFNDFHIETNCIHTHLCMIAFSSKYYHIALGHKDFSNSRNIGGGQLETLYRISVQFFRVLHPSKRTGNITIKQISALSFKNRLLNLKLNKAV